jgi:hypothetical protein
LTETCKLPIIQGRDYTDARTWSVSVSLNKTILKGGFMILEKECDTSCIGIDNPGGGQDYEKNSDFPDRHDGMCVYGVRGEFHTGAVEDYRSREHHVWI